MRPHKPIRFDMITPVSCFSQYDMHREKNIWHLFFYICCNISLTLSSLLELQSCLFLFELCHHLCGNVTIPEIHALIGIGLFHLSKIDRLGALLFCCNWILLRAFSLCIHHAHLYQKLRSMAHIHRLF